MVTNTNAETACDHSHDIIQAGRRTVRDLKEADRTYQVQTVVESAGQRMRLVTVVDQSSLALSVVLCGAIAMLLLGTDILNWPWLLLLAVVGLLITFRRVRARTVDRYRIAQLVDESLGLSDALPTAWFLLKNSQAGQIAFADAQIERAGNAARDFDAASVFPFIWRKTWIVTGVLAAVALGLFTLRYLLADSLSLKQSLIPLSFSFPAEVLERLDKLTGERPNRTGAAGKGEKSALRAPGPVRDQNLENSSREGSNLANESNGGDPSKQSNANGDTPRQDGKVASGKPNGEQSPKEANGTEHGREAGNQPSRSDQSANTPPDAKEQQPSASQQPGLMARMKDALSGMMSKMRPHEANGQKAGEQGQSGQSSKGGEGDAKSNVEPAQSNANRSDSEKAQGQSREQSGLGQAQADASEKLPSTQSHASDESANRKGSDAQSGVGRQDGEKAIKETEQLRAMGKLDEIIGKRSANLTGDITIETHSSRQQLETQYSGRTARHTDSGGEIDRDEIPMALQKYVREYMEQVRKQANRQ